MALLSGAGMSPDDDDSVSVDSQSIQAQARVDSEALLGPSNLDLSRRPSALRSACRFFWVEIVAERTETIDFVTFGRRLPYRRIWLLLGLGAYSYLVFSQLSTLLDTTVRGELNGLFDEMGWNVTWPDGGNGTTIFDQAFDVYKEASWISWYLLAGGFALLFLSLATAVLCRSRRGLSNSRWVTYLSLAVLFSGILGPAMPNYLAETNITDLVPSCAPKFDNAVRKVWHSGAWWWRRWRGEVGDEGGSVEVRWNTGGEACFTSPDWLILFIYIRPQVAGDVVGVTCAAMFTMKLCAVLVSVVPAFVRAANLMLGSYKVRFDLLCHANGGPMQRSVSLSLTCMLSRNPN